MTSVSQAWKQYFAHVREKGEDIDRPMLWSFRLSDVAAGDIPRLKAELKRKGYQVTVSATLTESVPSKICAEQIVHHTAESIAKAWEEFEAIAARYSCHLASAGYEAGDADAI